MQLASLFLAHPVLFCIIFENSLCLMHSHHDLHLAPNITRMQTLTKCAFISNSSTRFLSFISIKRLRDAVKKSHAKCNTISIASVRWEEKAASHRFLSFFSFEEAIVSIR